VLEILESTKFFFRALFGRQRVPGEPPERLAPNSSVPQRVDFGEAFGVSGGYNKAYGDVEGRQCEFARGIHPLETSYDEGVCLASYRPRSQDAGTDRGERGYGSYDSGKSPSHEGSTIGRAL